MHTLNASYRSLSVLFFLNVDRILFTAAIGGALWLGTFLGGL